MILTCSTFFSVAHADTGVTKSGDIVHSESGKIVSITKKAYLEVDKNGIAHEVGSKSEIFEKARGQFNKTNKSTIHYHNPKAENKTFVEPSIVDEGKEDKASASPSAASRVTMDYTVTFNPDKKTVTSLVKIDSIVGQKPILIIGGNDLYTSNEMNGSYGRVMEHTKEFKGAQIKAGSKSTKTYNVKSTKFWIAKNVTTVAWTGYVPLTDTSEAGPRLANKIADFYPTIYNKHSKKYMPIPTKANMKPVPEDKRTPWDSSKDRDAYIKKYIKTYGDPKWNWKLVDIHHVIPREYGGNNAFNNLYPLPREMHQQVVNPWWLRYK